MNSPMRSGSIENRCAIPSTSIYPRSRAPIAIPVNEVPLFFGTITGFERAEILRLSFPRFLFSHWCTYIARINVKFRSETILFFFSFLLLFSFLNLVRLHKENIKRKILCLQEEQGVYFSHRKY